MKEKEIIIISGPTGVGENSIFDELCKRYQNCVRLVTATTREPRLGEQDKVDYHFLSNEEFQREIDKGNIPEYQNSRDKNVFYGTYLPDLRKKIEEKKIIIVLTDITGSRYFKENWNATTIFILPDSMENLRKRHLKRDPSADKEELDKRLEYAQYEIDNEADFYDYKIVNAQDKLSDTVDEVADILNKEGYRLIKKQKQS